MKRIATLLAGGLGLAACATTAPTPTATAAPRPTISTAGLQRVMGQSAAALVALFGDPAQDVREDSARKLQFAGGGCVLDTYLYPAGGGEPVVTHVDARSPVGEDVDRAACVEALTRR